MQKRQSGSEKELGASGTGRIPDKTGKGQDVQFFQRPEGKFRRPPPMGGSHGRRALQEIGLAGHQSALTSSLTLREYTIFPRVRCLTSTEQHFPRRTRCKLLLGNIEKAVPQRATVAT